MIAAPAATVCTKLRRERFSMDRSDMEESSEGAFSKGGGRRRGVASGRNHPSWSTTLRRTMRRTPSAENNRSVCVAQLTSYGVEEFRQQGLRSRTEVAVHSCGHFPQ